VVEGAKLPRHPAITTRSLKSFLANGQRAPWTRTVAGLRPEGTGTRLDGANGGVQVHSCPAYYSFIRSERTSALNSRTCLLRIGENTVIIRAQSSVTYL